MERRRHQRFIKRLTAKFIVDCKSFTGISGDLSENGLFIRTTQSFAANTPVDIQLLLPNNKVAFLKGIVRRTFFSSMKNGMGIEIIEKDGTFIDFVKSFFCGKEADTVENRVIQEPQIISCSHCEIENKDSKNAIQEKRRDKRFKVGNLKVNGEMLSASDIKILDISISGVLVKTDKRLNIGNKYALKIGYKGKLLFAKTAVVWSLLVESREDTKGNIVPIYLAGMQFTDVPNEKIREMVNFIEIDVQDDIIPCNSRERPVKPETESSIEFIEQIEDIYSRYENKTLSYYEILDVKNLAGTEEIKKAYYKKTKEFHPDRHLYLTPDIKKKLNIVFAYLTEAYEVLMNSENKEKYERNLISEQHATVSNKESAHQEFERGRIEFWNNNFSEAKTFFQNAIYFDSSSEKYFYFYAMTLLRLEELHEAEKAIKTATDINPLNPDYLVEAGHIYLAMGLLYRARESFETALRFQPSHVKAYEGILRLENKKGYDGFRSNIHNPIKALKKFIVK